MPFKLYNKDNGKLIGSITDEQLTRLKELLEEEDSDDKDYYVDADLIEYLEEEGYDASVVELLKKEITAEEGVEIEWREE